VTGPDRKKRLRVRLRFIGRRKPTCPHEWRYDRESDLAVCEYCGQREELRVA
jgi:hypothetical protein